MTFEYDIFISYAHEDERFARRLCDRLIADGHRVWWDSRKLSLPGADISGSIELGLARSRAFGLIVSKAALSSSWVKTEYAAAVTLNIRDETNRTIIPIVIENVDLPIFLLNRRWADFRDDASFDPSVRSLGESLRTGLPAPLAPLPEGSRTQLHELMLSAKHELVISGHTLDKFTTNPKVLQALYSLFDRSLSVIIVLLNPYSPYALAHDQFHTKESRASAQNQIRTTIQQLSNILEVADRTPCLSVYLTRYMPRFRMVLIDNSVCHVNLYMYGTDVLQTPELIFSGDPGGPTYHEFTAVQQSTRSLLRSQDVFPLIREGWYDRYWTSSRIDRVLGNCIQGLCSDAGCSTVRDIIFGSHIDDSQAGFAQTGVSEQLCPQDYTPGTVSVGRAQSLVSPRGNGRPPDRIIDGAIADRLLWLSREYPGNFSEDGRDDLVRKATLALGRSHYDHSVLWHSLYVEQWEDIVDRVICSIRFGHPEPLLHAASRTPAAKEQMLALITWLSDHKSPSVSEWLTLSIAAEAFSHSNIFDDLAKSGEQLWEFGRSVQRIDASGFFFHVIRTSYQLPMYVVCFSSTLLATLLTLKFYDALLRDAETLHVDFVPRAVNVGTYASCRDVLDVLPYFSTLYQEHSRFHVHHDGSKSRAIDLKRLSSGVAAAVDRAFFLDVRGSLSFRSVQRLGKMTFFGFIAQERFDLELVGAEGDTFWLIFIRQYPYQVSFELAVDARADRPVRVLKSLMAHKDRWAGGPITTSSNWSARRLERFELLRRFYTNRAAQFHQMWGDPDRLEIEVSQPLSTLSHCRRVLVLGCGSGKEVHELKKLNPRASVIGLDFISEPILYARSRYPSREEFLVADFYELRTLFDVPCDGLVANAAFVHLLERSDFDEMLSAFHAVLEPGGRAFIRILEKGDVREEVHGAPQFFGVERWFVYYHDSEVASAAKANALDIIWRDRVPHAHYPGIHWLSYMLQKPIVPVAPDLLADALFESPQ